jgi:phage antirepressor YoqD-like protein
MAYSVCILLLTCVFIKENDLNKWLLKTNIMLVNTDTNIQHYNIGP